MIVFYEYLARQITAAHLFQLQLGFHRVSVIAVVSQRSLFRTLHGLLGYQRSSALFRPVCLSSTCLSSTCLSSTCLSSTCLSSTCLSSTCLSSTCLSSTCLSSTCLSSTCLSIPR